MDTNKRNSKAVAINRKEGSRTRIVGCSDTRTTDGSRGSTDVSSQVPSLSCDGKMRVVSLFAGAGGLDLGFERAGFEVTWANEYDKDIWETYQKNHQNTFLDKRSIVNIPSNEMPDCDGIIGGPPCQSWSVAGSMRGITDKRGQLFYEFVRIVADKKPKFFLAENVPGMLSPKNKNALNTIKGTFYDCGYRLSFELLDVSDYGIPQHRKRVFLVGYRDDMGLGFEFPKPTDQERKTTLRDVIWDLWEGVLPTPKGTNGGLCVVPNHEYLTGGFSPRYMSRNRVRGWDEPSFTVQATARHIPLHPQAPKMVNMGQDEWRFVKGNEDLYRRLSVRECARVQTFPDDFVFCCDDILAGYKMVGNAVPVEMGYILAKKIFQDLEGLKDKNDKLPIETTGVELGRRV